MARYARGIVNGSRDKNPKYFQWHLYHAGEKKRKSAIFILQDCNILHNNSDFNVTRQPGDPFKAPAFIIQVFWKTWLR